MRHCCEIILHLSFYQCRVEPQSPLCQNTLRKLHAAYDDLIVIRYKTRELCPLINTPKHHMILSTQISSI